jgi:hypothetical protein
MQSSHVVDYGYQARISWVGPIGISQPVFKHTAGVEETGLESRFFAFLVVIGPGNRFVSS